MKYPPIQYHDYLKLDQLLSAQALRSQEFGKTAHDELLFITVHQTYELWFKQILFELDSILEIFSKNYVPESSLGMAIARLNRIIEIQKLVAGQIDVLETMTPMDFLEFRDMLFPASGFQSYQWRLLETRLGLSEKQRHTYNQAPFYLHLKEHQQTEIQQILKKPSLFELVEKWLERTPFLQIAGFDFWKLYKDSVAQLFTADLEIVKSNQRLSPEEKQQNIQQIEDSQKSLSALFDAEKYSQFQKEGHFRISYKALHAALFIQVYRDQPLLTLPFQLLSKILDIDENMTMWRYRHAQMVHRMLGKKIGTGGSSGHDYLRMATERHKIFSDFFNLSTYLIPRSSIPELPADVIKKLNFPS